jgi:acetoacetate decarboxylase
MAGFVRTHEEIERIGERFAENRFLDAERLSVRYHTRPEIVERVLPPGLASTDEPLVRVDVVEVGASNCVGSFAAGGLYVQARHGDVVGSYCLSMPMSTDRAVTWGRELFGEPKKLASVDISREGDEVAGRIDRYGEPIIELEATMVRERTVDPDPRTVFHYKHLPDVAGDGFQFDPTLVAVTFESELRRFETGEGSLSLATTEHDPLGEIEVVEPLGAAYSVADIASSQRALTTVDPEAFLPYAYGAGRVDDWLALDNEDRAGAADDGNPTDG